MIQAPVKFGLTKWLLLLSIFLPILTTGAPDTLWTKTFGGASDDNAWAIHQVRDSGFIIAGGSSSFNPDNSDVYLIRADKNGDTLWTRTYPQADFDEAWDILQTDDGGFVIAGYTNAYSATMKDIYLIRTNAQGDTLWTRTYGTEYDDDGYSIVRTHDGGYAIVGETTSYIQDSIINKDVYLIRVNSTGDTLWTKTFGGDSTDVGYTLQQTPDSGFIIGGYTSSFGTSAEDFDLYLIKTNLHGDTLWTKTFGSAEWDIIRAIALTNDNGYIATGVIGTENSHNVYIIRFDEKGDTLWTRSFGDYSKDNGHSIQPTNDGGFIICGSTRSYSVGEADVYLIRITGDGDTLWTKAIGDTFWDFGNIAKQTFNGGYIVAGFTFSYGAGGYDAYLIRLDKENVAIQQKGLSKTQRMDDLFLSHNHGSNNVRLNFDLAASGHITLAVYDTRGKLIDVIADSYVQKGSHNVQWNMNQADNKGASGVYLFRIGTMHSDITRKLTIVK